MRAVQQVPSLPRLTKARFGEPLNQPPIHQSAEHADDSLELLLAQIDEEAAKNGGQVRLLEWRFGGLLLTICLFTHRM